MCYLPNPSQKIVGPSTLERTRGRPTTILSETGVSFCSTRRGDEDAATYSWSLVSADESVQGAASLNLDYGRDPRVLTIPAKNLGFAGSTYTFQLRSVFGDVQNTVNATGEASTQSLPALCNCRVLGPNQTYVAYSIIPVCLRGSSLLFASTTVANLSVPTIVKQVSARANLRRNAAAKLSGAKSFSLAKGGH